MIPPCNANTKTQVRVFAMMINMKLMVMRHEDLCPLLMQQVMNITKCRSSPGEASDNSKKIIKAVCQIEKAAIHNKQ
jgi:hypothetical protein